MAAVATLRVDYIDRPLGLENRRPRFSWTLEGEGRDVRQAAWRIRVAAHEAALADGDLLWDSGRAASSRSLDIVYDGPELASRQRCVWRVSAWLAAEGEPIGECDVLVRDGPARRQRLEHRLDPPQPRRKVTMARRRCRPR